MERRLTQMASNDNPTVWQEAERALHADPTVRPYAPPQPTGSDLTSTFLLNSAEQTIAFVTAHLDQLKNVVAQYRQLNGL
jgi:hypothetical protein